MFSDATTLDKYQLAAAQLPIDNDVQIIAGPGTGKTLALVGRVAHMLKSGIPAASILVLSFTNRAMRTFQARLHDLVGSDGYPVEVYTFHAFCQAILRNHGASYLEISDFNWSPNWGIADVMDQEQLVMHMKRYSPEGHYISGTVRSALSHIDMEKRRLLVDPQTSLSALTQAYNRELQNSNLLDYNDLLFYGKKLVDLAGGEFLPYANILVDEFQDTSPVKWELIKQLKNRSHAALTVVGDPNQSIYGFQGVDGQIFTKMKTELDCDVTALQINHRSSKEIVKASNSLLPDNVNISGNFPGSKPIFKQFTVTKKEMEWVAAEIKNLMAQTPSLQMKDFAVLARTNVGVQEAVKWLHEYDMEAISFNATSALLHSPNVYPLCTILKIIHNLSVIQSGEPRHSLDIMLLSLLRNKSSGPVLKDYGKTGPSQRIWNYAQEHQCGVWEALRVISSKGSSASSAPYKKKVTELLDYMEWAEKQLRDSSNYNDIFKVLDKLIKLWGLPSAKESSDVARFYSSIKDAAKFPSSKPEGEATLLETVIENFRLQNISDNSESMVATTVHNSKGLEWPVVFIVGASDRSFPVQIFGPGKDVDEERRVLYVGMTRAMNKLYISCSKYSSISWPYGVSENFSGNPRSRFLTKQVLSNFDVNPASKIMPISSVDNLSPAVGHMEGYLEMRKKLPKVFHLPASAKAYGKVVHWAKRRIL